MQQGGSMPQGIPARPSDSTPYDIKKLPFIKVSVLKDHGEENATINAINMAYHQSQHNIAGFVWAFGSDALNMAINNKLSQFALTNTKKIVDDVAKAMLGVDYEAIGLTYKDVKAFTDAFAKAYKKEAMKAYLNRVPTEIVHSNFEKQVLNKLSTSLTNQQRENVTQTVRAFALDVVEAVNDGNSRKASQYKKTLNYVQANQVHDAMGRATANLVKDALDRGVLSVSDFEDMQAAKIKLAVLFNQAFAQQGVKTGYVITREMMEKGAGPNETSLRRKGLDAAVRELIAKEKREDPAIKGLIEATDLSDDMEPEQTISAGPSVADR